MLAMVALPAGITLHAIRVTATPVVSSPNPTPYGYTLSLLLFLVPIVVVGIWFLPNEGPVLNLNAVRKAGCMLISGSL